MEKSEVMHAYMALHYLCSTLLETLDEQGPAKLVRLVKSFRDEEDELHNTGEPMFNDCMDYLDSLDIDEDGELPNICPDCREKNENEMA